MGILKIEMTGFLFGAQNPNLRQSSRGLEVITAQIVQIREANLRGSAPEDAKKEYREPKFPILFFGADYGARTRHLDLGKVALYQMS